MVYSLKFISKVRTNHQFKKRKKVNGKNTAVDGCRILDLRFLI